MPLDWLIIGAMLIVRRCIVKIEIHEMTLNYVEKNKTLFLREKILNLNIVT